MKTSSVLVVFSVTTSARPDGENWICAAPLPANVRIEPAIGLSFPSFERKPAMLLLAALTT